MLAAAAAAMLCCCCCYAMLLLLLPLLLCCCCCCLQDATTGSACVVHVQGRSEAKPLSTFQVAINWCMCKGAVPIPGAKSLSQAKDSLGAMGWRLSLGEVEALEAAAKQSGGELVQNIFQTK